MDPSDPQPFFYSQVTSMPSVTSGTASGGGVSEATAAQMILLMRQMAMEQHRTNELLLELTRVTVAPYRHRMKELAAWKTEHPDLAQNCRHSVESLLRTQLGWLETMTMEVQDGEETLRESEFMLNELLDRFGPRVSFMNGMLQLLSQLAADPPPEPSNVRVVSSMAPGDPVTEEPRDSSDETGLPPDTDPEV